MASPASALVSVSRHERGGPTAEAKSGTGRRGKILAIYLMSDLQGNWRMTREVIERLHKVERGETKSQENDGNSFNLILRQSGATIEDLMLEDEPPEEYSLAEIRAALEDWMEFIEDDRRK